MTVGEGGRCRKGAAAQQRRQLSHRCHLDPRRKRWHLDPSLSKTELPAADAPATKDGLLLTDIAVIPPTDETVEPHFIALWSESANADEQRRVLLDLTEAELTAAKATLTQQGFISQNTITVRTDHGGQRYYTGIWSNQGARSELRPAYAGFELVKNPQWDVALGQAAKLTDPLETFRRQLTQMEELPAVKLDDPEVREARGCGSLPTGQSGTGPCRPGLPDQSRDRHGFRPAISHTTLARLGKGMKRKSPWQNTLQRMPQRL